MAWPLLRRIAFDTVIVASVFLLPWWVVFLLVFLALFAYGMYESALAGLMLDILYAASPDRWGGFEFMYTTIFTLLLVGYLYAQRHLKTN
jgi:hypothetical protein